MKFSYSKMDSCCAEMQATVNNIKEILNDVGIACSQLLKNDCWNGQAGSFYFEKLSQLTSQFDEIGLELDHIVSYLRDTIESYHSVDRNIESAIANVINGIGDAHEF